MARNKEPELIDINRKRILEVAKRLFLENGIDNTKIDLIAKEAGMSKSTLYVYFESKEEIKNYISLEAMQFLYEELSERLPKVRESLYEKYMEICHILVEFKEAYPLNFELLVGKIDIDELCLEKDAVLREIYEVGEKINQFIIKTIMEKNEVKNSEEDEESLISKIFIQWGSIYGVILMADNKKEYIEKNMHMTKEQFLAQGFEQLYLTWNRRDV